MSFNRKDLEKHFDDLIEIEKEEKLSTSLKSFIQGLFIDLSRVIETVEALSEENKVIKERLEQLEYAKKTSDNSSIPPALDPNRKRGRKKKQVIESTKKRLPGGQEGREGKTLKKVENPDEIINYPLAGRCQCGKALSGLKQSFEERQVFEIELKRKVVSHRAACGICKCGLKHKASFPQEVRSPVK